MDEYGYVVNVDGAVVREDEYLLIERGADEEHAAGELAFPGGKLETPPGTDDAIAKTARRELREEVGIEVGAVTYVCSSTFTADDGTQCLNVVTLCEHTGGVAQVCESAEVETVHWLSPEELRNRSDVQSYLVEYVEAVELARGQ
ncbi:ADP-ribose pyrophosphatase [Halovivax ruber XH-70]|uniref:ADP-ribose pyrophosphatase n=1 Tax=Halovivax ruber (strain DSM 18193 / JCM 13892 / XH-70) TaxID=797302 RepID=L0I7M2_HALRX|nr:NUDIX domain-containing protein [Halovivax ruber]AGB14689.1 ADP-ribose pyrophosphatase [Halovivax ruber XH-70]